MRLTSFTDYTLRVLIYLGIRREADDQLATIADIANAYGISQNHLMKVVHHLSRAGYVETLRGHGGGMRLAMAPGQINIGDVVRGAEESFAVVACLEEGNVDCPITGICALRGVLKAATAAFIDVLDKQTLADLLQPGRALLRTFTRQQSRTGDRTG